MPEANLVLLMPRLFCRATEGRPLDLRGSTRGSYLCHPTALNGDNGNRWRTLEVTVTPDSIQAVWEGEKSVATITRKEWRADLETMFASLRPQEPSLPGSPDLDPRGPLGLFVVYGSASVRQVVVEPLAEEALGLQRRKP
jgi:hypothetical protein